MGQKNGKQAKRTPNLSSECQRPNLQGSPIEAATGTTTVQPGANEPQQTGNLVITIRMMTMNSNELNNNSGGSSCCGADENIASSVSVRERANSTVAQKEPDVHPTTANDNQTTMPHLVLLPSWDSSSATSDDSQKSSSKNMSGNSSLADKISNILSSKCKISSSHAGSSSQCVHQSNSIRGTSTPVSTKVKAKKSNWGLGKLTIRSRREKKKEPSEANNAELAGKSGSELNGRCAFEQTSGPTTSNNDQASLATNVSCPDASLTNPLIFSPNASISILNGTSSTTGSGATTTAAAFILPDTIPSVMTTGTAAPTFIHHSNVMFDSTTAATLYGSLSNGTSGGNFILVSPFIDVTRTINPDEYSLEDCDEQARWRRALQIAEGIEAPPGFVPSKSGASHLGTPIWQTVVYHQSDAASFQSFVHQFKLPKGVLNPEDLPRVHSQADYIHCLVPDLDKITSCCFYWGKMDRFEAEKLLDGKPEGTFLLRDSAQEEFLFSVSFRKYGRSLHARIEQFNHEFSFDSHDPGVYTADTVTGLLEHYKDPSCVMFFEPMLTLPLHRNFVFSLQELSRATIVSNTNYDGIDKLDVPRMIKSYLKKYHYKQRVHYKTFDNHIRMDS